MRKAINGKIVTIDNMEIFRQAEKDLLVNRSCTSSLDDMCIYMDEFEADIVNDVVMYYRTLYEALPYPLYALDTPIKYATLGLLIKQSIPEIDVYVEDCSLKIAIEQCNFWAIQFINKSYKVAGFSKEGKDKVEDLSKYQNTKYYIYFEYVFNKLDFSDSSEYVDLTDFYSLISSNILSACQSKEDIAAQLGEILKIKDVPRRAFFKSNVIVDVSNGKEYIINFIRDGVDESSEPSGMKCISLVTGKVTNSISKDVTQLWKLDCYVREDDDSKLKPSTRTGFYTLFYTLCSIREANKLSYFPDFKAVIVDGRIVVEINRKVYVAPSDRLGNLKEVAESARLFSMSKNNIYIEVEDKNGQIVESSIYCYNTRKDVMELCQTRYHM